MRVRLFRATISLACLLYAAAGLAQSTEKITIEQFGGAAGAPSPSVNNTTALNNALTFAKANRVREIVFGAGEYWFQSQPHDIDFGITLRGHGKGRTVLMRDYIGSTGFLTFVAGAGSSIVQDLGIVASATSSGGNAIRMIGTSAGSPDFSKFSNLYLSAQGNNNWDVTVYIDGTARTNAPIGVRDVEFLNCSIFGATNAGLVLDGVVAFTFSGGGLFPASGNTGKVVISPSNQMDSYYINIDSTFIDGILMQRSLFGNFRGYFGRQITTSSHSQHNVVIGHVVGGIQPYWVGGTHVGTVSGTSP